MSRSVSYIVYIGYIGYIGYIYIRGARVLSRSVGFAMKLATPPAMPPATIIFHSGVSRGVPAPSAVLIGL